MSDDFSADEPRTGSGLIRKAGWVLAALLVLLVVSYFVVSNTAFLKGVILPRVARSLNADITVDTASLSPFSQLTLDKLRVQPKGAEPLLTAGQLRVRYRLLPILRGHYVIDELTLTTPVIQIVQETNGTSNLDALTKGEESKPSPPRAEPLRLAVRNVTLKDAVLRQVTKTKDGAVQTVECQGLNLSLDRLANGQPGTITVASAVKLDNRVAPGSVATPGLIEGKADGKFEFKLDDRLLPQSVTGNAHLALPRAQGQYADLAPLDAVLQADLTPTELRQLVLRFERNGQSLGQVRASGPLDLAKTEGRLTLEVQSIDRHVLNLYGATRHWDFMNSTLNATNTVNLSNRGEVIDATGLVVGRQMSVRAAGSPPTPLVDLSLDYKVTVNVKDQTAVVERLNLVGQQQQKEFLRAAILPDQAMTLSRGSTVRSIRDSTNQLVLTQFDLGPWRPVLGTHLPSGRLDWWLTITAKNDAKQLLVGSTNIVHDFTAQFGTNRLERAQVRLALDGKLENFNSVRIDRFNLDVQQNQQPLVQAGGSAHYDLSKKDLSLQLNSELALPNLLRQFPMPPLAASKGVVRCSSAFTQKDGKSSVTGNLFLGDFTGSYDRYAFEDYQTALDYNLVIDRPVVKVRTASLNLRRGYNTGGNLSVTGDYDLDKQAANLTFRFTDLNENALGPFLAPSLGEKKLVSISLSGSGSTTYDPRGDASLKADLGLTNWVVATPQFVSPKLAAQLQLDGSLRQQIVELRQFLVKLSPTQRAKNELQASARLDLRTTNASPSRLTLQADSLDLTPYYDMFAGTATPTNAPVGRPAPGLTPPPTVKPTEPDPVQLPLEQLTAEVKIGRLHLREVNITNLQTTASIHRGQVTLKPCELNVNGGTVSANALLNLGVRGYTYDAGLKAEGVPLESLSNTFTTNAPGFYNGTLFGTAQLKGAGITGPSLQKNLSGSLSLSLTNMNYDIVGQKTRRLLQPISLVLQLPELMQTPINWIDAQAQIGNGQIDLQRCIIRSQAFYAETQGRIPMAEELTNSPLKLPVALSLNRSLAIKTQLVSTNTPTNTIYAALPTFVTLTGTLGDPQTEVNKLVIAGLLARSIGGLAPVGEKASALLQGLGSAVAGQSRTSPASTNAPAGTNATPAASIVESVGALLDRSGQQRAVTNPPAAATNPPARFNPLDLLNKLQEKK